MVVRVISPQEAIERAVELAELKNKAFSSWPYSNEGNLFHRISEINHDAKIPNARFVVDDTDGLIRGACFGFCPPPEGIFPESYSNHFYWAWVGSRFSIKRFLQKSDKVSRQVAAEAGCKGMVAICIKVKDTTRAPINMFANLGWYQIGGIFHENGQEYYRIAVDFAKTQNFNRNMME